MKTIHADLQTAQDDPNHIPYMKLVFQRVAGGTTYDYSSRKIEHMHVLEAYNDYATIILRNEDLAVVDLLGYWVEIGYGFTTSSGDRSSPTPRLWVKSQQTRSMEGELVEILSLEGLWSALREQLLRVGSPPFYTTEYTTDTIYNIITAILSETAVDNFTVVLNQLVQDDGIINSFVPEFEVKNQPFEDAGYLISILMAMTNSYLRPKATEDPLIAGRLEVIFPQDSDAVDVTYYSDQVHYFFEYLEKRNILTPNHIVVIANQDPDTGEWPDVITGEAQDLDEITAYHDVTAVHVASTIRNQADADTRAEVILTKAKAEVLSARLIIPMDVRVELYDRAAVADYRGA